MTRIIDLHCYPGTKEWIACQGPYVEALAKYWKREWVGKSEDEVLQEFTDAGVDACLVALDLIGFFHDDVVKIREEVRDRHPEVGVRAILVASTHTHATPAPQAPINATAVKSVAATRSIATVHTRTPDVTTLFNERRCS